MVDVVVLGKASQNCQVRADILVTTFVPQISQTERYSVSVVLMGIRLILQLPVEGFREGDLYTG